MLNLLLFAFKFFFLFLLYIFLFLLVRMVYKDITSNKSSQLGSDLKFQALRPRLVVLEAPQGEVGKTYNLKDRAVIGRSSRSDVTIDDTFASSSHARILKKNNHFVLEDLGSTNGTYLEGEKINEPSPLKTGSRIRIGNTLLELLQ